MRENQKPGATDWQLTRVRLDRVGGFRSPWIEGYCSKQSVQAGESIDIMVSTNPPKRFQIEIFRTGYYGGCGARLMTTLGPFHGKTQPTPEPGDRALVECQWEPALTLTIPQDWLSGVYLGRLTLLTGDPTKAAWQSYVVFIVRDKRPADILLQCSDNTWQASICCSFPAIPSAGSARFAQAAASPDDHAQPAATRHPKPRHPVVPGSGSAPGESL